MYSGESEVVELRKQLAVQQEFLTGYEAGTAERVADFQRRLTNNRDFIMLLSNELDQAKADFAKVSADWMAALQQRDDANLKADQLTTEAGAMRYLIDLVAEKCGPVRVRSLLKSEGFDVAAHVIDRCVQYDGDAGRDLLAELTRLRTVELLADEFIEGGFVSVVDCLADYARLLKEHGDDQTGNAVDQRTAELRKALEAPRG